MTIHEKYYIFEIFGILKISKKIEIFEKIEICRGSRTTRVPGVAARDGRTPAWKSQTTSDALERNSARAA